MPRIGVLALQGDFREHAEVLSAIGTDYLYLKRPEQISQIDGLIIPGGESTVMSKLAKSFGLFDPLSEAIAAGLPALGTCAGLIMLAREILDPASGQESFGGLDVTVRRNAFGHQVDSFEADLSFKGISGSIHAAFIRAPIVQEVGEGVEVLCQLADQRIIAVRQKNVLGISFHPEVTGENRVHSFFLNMIGKNDS